MDCTQILPELHLGSCPEGPEDVDQLQRKLGITAVLNLQTDEDLEGLECDWPRLTTEYRRLRIRVRRVPIRDFDHEDLRKQLPRCVQALNELLREGHTVYIHCTGGMGRSPSVVIAYLHWVQQIELDQAVRRLTTARRCSPDLEAIRLAGEDVWGKEGRS